MKIGARRFVLGLFLFLSILLDSCNMVETAHPTITAPIDEPKAAGPAEGTLMSWVDGSTLVFYKGVWVYRSEVTNYQLLLCVESGNCLLPAVDAPPSDDNVSDNSNSPAQIIGPEAQQAYCTWAGGRMPTEQEASALALNSYPAGGVDTTSILIGLLSPGTLHGTRCIVDAPGPMASTCQTSAFYLNGAPPEMDHTVTQAGQFCQNGVGYVTLDINLPDGGILQSANGDCEVVGENRVLCSNQSGPSGEGEALILVNGLLPADQRQGLAGAGQLQCLPGYAPHPDSPTQCGFGELLPAVQNDSGPATAQLQDSNDQFAGQVSPVVFQPNSMLSANLDVRCPEPLSFSERLGRCVFDIPAEDLARAGRNTGTSPAFWNPLEGYPPPNADGTCPEGSTLLNGLYCVPNEDDGGPYGFGNPARPWNPLRGFPPANADGTCPEGTTLLYGHCIPGEPPPGEDGGGPLDFEFPSWNPFAGYPLASPDGTCPEGSTNYYGYCIPDEPAPSEDEGWGFGWDPITGYPPRNPDGTCPEGTSLFLDLYCLPNGAARNEGPSFGISWNPLGGFPLPDGYGGCPEGSALINGHCIPSEPPPGGSGDLTGSGLWNPLAGYPAPNADGICPPDSTLLSGHCIPSEPAPGDNPSEDARCMPGYWFSETLGVCLPDVTFGCPVGTYYDKDEGMCIASGEPTSLTLPGFHFDEASQCSLTDLPSGRYPGCPTGQAFDPSTGSCDFRNIYVDDGKLLSTVQFNFSAPFCEVKDNSGGGGCTLSDAACAPKKFDAAKCNCY